MPTIFVRILVALLVTQVVVACATAQETVAATSNAPQRVAAARLPNAFRLHERVFSGGLPEGDAAFEELQTLGVKTLISVDGARPDLATATRYGLRYVHLPHGYDGIPPQRIAQLAKAVRDLPGPLYIHCHHGKHRSPAAAAAACVAAGLLPPESTMTILTVAGTSQSYQGLYESALATRQIDGPALDALEADFPETAQLPAMAEAMVQIERLHDHLKHLAANDWQTPTDKPDLDPSHEALLLREQFTELLRTPAVKQQPVAFQQLLRESEQATDSLEKHLRAARSDEATKSLRQLTQQCAACHRGYRDVPLSQKQTAKSE